MKIYSLSVENSRNWLDLIEALPFTWWCPLTLLLYCSGWITVTQPRPPPIYFLSVTPEDHPRESWALSSSSSGLGNTPCSYWRGKICHLWTLLLWLQVFTNPNQMQSAHNTKEFDLPDNWLMTQYLYLPSESVTLVSFSDHAEPGAHFEPGCRVFILERIKSTFAGLWAEYA